MKNPAFSILLLAVLGTLIGCGTKPKGAFLEPDPSSGPDYSDERMWAALPFKVDSADLSPSADLPDLQSEARADVFFLYPTTYTGKKGQNQWNASLQDVDLNQRTDETTIKYQASLFNGAGRVFAPRYRQAHLEVFYTDDRKKDAAAALKLAYSDVARAFQYYLDHYNEGRPIIIASHSQGAWHGAQLLKQFFDGKSLEDKLIVAYLVGMATDPEQFERIEPCETPEQTGCICSWRTVKDGHYPKRWYVPNSGIIVTNPLTWSADQPYGGHELNKGAILKKFYNGPYPELVDARVDDGLLMIKKPKIPGVPFVPMRNFHVADLNFYYVNVRENARERVEAYLSKAE